jgi:ABC-2 type transport system permease protein
MAPAGRFPGLAAVGIAARGALRGALLWGGVFGLLIWVLISQFGKEYPTAASRVMLVQTMGSNVGLQAIFGMAHHLGTVAGYTAYHAIGVLGLIGAVWGLLAATRALRGGGRRRPLGGPAGGAGHPA